MNMFYGRTRNYDDLFSQVNPNKYVSDLNSITLNNLGELKGQYIENINIQGIEYSGYNFTENLLGTSFGNYLIKLGDIDNDNSDEFGILSIKQSDYSSFFDENSGELYSGEVTGNQKDLYQFYVYDSDGSLNNFNLKSIATRNGFSDNFYFSGTEKMISLGDFNGDGFDDFIFTDGNTIRLVTGFSELDNDESILV